MKPTASLDSTWSTLLLCGLVCLASGCGGGSTSDEVSGLSNQTGPQVINAQYVDVDGNGVDEDDLLIVTFDKVVFIASASTLSYEFDSTSDSLGSGAFQAQSVPGSTRVEIVLGASPSFLVGISRLNTKSSGAINVKDTATVEARPAATSVVLAEITAIAPTLLATAYNDADLDGSINVGDTLLCEFDKPIAIASGQSVAGNFSLPVTSDTFGTSPSLSAFSNSPGNRAALITLSSGAVLTVSGTFDALVTTSGSPSGIEVAGSAGITDTLTSGSATITTGTTADVVAQGASKFRLQQQATLFPGNTDGAAPDVGAGGFFGPRGSFHFNGSVTVSGNTFSIDLFFVADTENNRVLVFDGKPTGNGAGASVALGQPDLQSNLPNQSGATDPSPDANSLLAPTDVHYDSVSNKLFVSDTDNHRVLIFHDVIDASGLLALVDNQSADVIIGQVTANAGDPNQGGNTPSSRSVSSPAGLHVSGGQLAVADRGNHRVLIWSSIPTLNNTPASTVLGQASFVVGVANGGGSTAADRMDTPNDVLIDTSLSIEASSGAILVADTGNHRALIFETSSPATGASADRVLGQASSTGSAAATTAAGLNSPSGVTATATHVLVADRDNHRVMVYAVASITADGIAGVPLGQASTTAAIENRDGTPGNDGLSFPRGISVSDATSPQLFVADTENHRVLNWMTVPTTDTVANLVHGQTAFTTSDAKGHLSNHPSALAMAVGKLFVADKLNNRVLIYNSIPTSGNPAPDVIVGQPDLFSTLANQGGSAGLSTLNAPEGVATDGTRLVVADTGNNRVLVFPTIPTADGAAAGFILGQTTTSGTQPNSTGISPASLDSPTGMALSGTRLLVCDRDNHRVLVFADITALSTGGSATVVIGQGDFASNLPNRGDTARATSLHTPQGVTVQGSRVLVADSKNHRILGFNNIPEVNGSSANFVVGQTAFNTTTSGTSNRTLTEPTAVATDGKRAMISDSGNHRILVFDTPLASTFPPADSVLGQPDFTMNSANRGLSTPSASSFSFPRGITFNGVDIWVADQKNSRVARYRD